MHISLELVVCCNMVAIYQIKIGYDRDKDYQAETLDSCCKNEAMTLNI